MTVAETKFRGQKCQESLHHSVVQGAQQLAAEPWREGGHRRGGQPSLQAPWGQHKKRLSQT